MLWLRAHPEVLDRIAWEAFEQIVAEILAGKGFTVDLAGRIRDKTADILAIRTDELGIETKYLIECKRYSKARRVGLDIVNGVLGAATRADVDHALLVTSSSYTRDVERLKPSLSELRLHLRDGEDVLKWLQDYRPRRDGGLWLATNWDEEFLV